MDIHNVKKVFLLIGGLVCLVFLLYYQNLHYKIITIEYLIGRTHERKILIKTYATESFGDKNNSYVSVVSTYFYFKSSKHSHEQYVKWLKTFFQSVSSPLILFTDKASIESLLTLRKHPTTLYVVNDIWELLKDLEIERNRSYLDNYLNVQPGLDPEKSIHNPQLYAVWNLKSFITSIVVRDNPYNSSAFIYTDSGAWRNKVFPNWPDVRFVKKIINVLEERIMFGQIFPYKPNPNFPTVDLIEGTFFMGSKSAINTFKNEFYRIHDERFDKGLFIGKDQTLMNLIAFDDLNDTAVRLRTWSNDCYENYDPWFFYQYYFARRNYYICHNSRFCLLS